MCRHGQIGIFPARGGLPTEEINRDTVYEVSSPYAGVHPRRSSCRTSADCIFPACGGSPNWGVGAAFGAPYLPRVRGFTCDRCLMRRAALVSSPYAGVHLSTRISTRARTCIFPVRGGLNLTF